MPYKHNEPHRHTIPNAKYKVGRWREYNRALRQRGRLTVWVSSEALATWTPVQTGRRGWSLAYSDLAIETGSCCAWRWAGVLSGWRGRIAHGKLVGMSTTPDPYRGFRFPAEIISEAVWLYHGFSLSLREVELILAARGIEVSDETIREWGLRFGREFANTLKRRRSQPGDTCLLDEVFIRIRGKQHHLWRAIDQNGVVLDILIQSRRNTKAAKRFFCKLLKGLRYAPRVLVTDKLKSYAAATKDLKLGREHRQSRYLNNAGEVSHQPTRRRERHRKRFKSARHAQRFLSPIARSTTMSSFAAI